MVILLNHERIIYTTHHNQRFYIHLCSLQQCLKYFIPYRIFVTKLIKSKTILVIKEKI